MSSKLTFHSTVSLSSGTNLPRLGFGVWDSPKHLTVQSCLEALKVGYRHIDGAQVYGNEAEVGQAVKQSSVNRSDVFITSKVLAPKDSDEETYKQCLQSVIDIAGEDGYLDLFLIHNGQAQGAKNIKPLWQAMEKLHQEGKFKAIGMSNTGVGLLEGMKAYAKVLPAVNQLELHPWCQQREVVDYCKKNGIAVEAYCPLVRNQKAEDPTLKGIADKHSKSTAQILLRYSLQKGWVPLPKSDNPGRIASNADLYDFELGDDDMKALDGLDQAGEGALVLAVDNGKKE
ncbi:unnamed protein product [Zymoseptoria tritici ST99CH_3D1]|uniref:NADP-dependent oxidoreductase domain-containing protein n=1 Tax=Zymoseptoria tritici (strain ST99CH_3D7) TaxID=1276538 RepID=A0A1X7RYE6_ZYMT9|nr:unnamed protein product [Zymoseptoria tritici ST99CH_3D7]SMR57649.1 unnamed protein product [Zymoseptoria tritici ST99CH_3D1]